MFKLLYYLPALLICSLIGTSAMASHQTGGNFNVECISGCTTRVHIRLYRDCSGASGISNALTFTPLNACAAPVALGAYSTQVTTEVTPICPSASTWCTNPSSTIYGIEEYYWYRDYSFCAAPGCSYEISNSSCCRNGIITSGASNNGFALTSTYTIQPTCNSSPVFTNTPLFYACAGLPYQIHQGAYDPDGDSLVYVLNSCYDSGTTPVTYSPGYSPTSPLGASWNVTLDPATGILDLTPNPGNIEVGVLCFMVQEYRNGVLIAQTMRDMQIIVGNFCGTAIGVPTISPITNLSGATALGPYTLSACGGSTLCFELGSTDVDVATGQSVTLSWDANIPTGTFSEVGNPSVQNSITGSSPDAQFCWSVPNTPGTYRFLVRAEDDGCPFPLYREQMITIHVGSGIGLFNYMNVSGTLDYCAGTTQTLTALPGFSSYQWSTGATTASIQVTGPGAYYLTVTSASGCVGLDTHVVFPPAPIDIDGTILDNANAPLANQRVWLIVYDFSTNSLNLGDSAMTDGNGYYKFCSVAYDTVYVKAAPSIGSYPNDLPTYADTAVWWANARPVLYTQFPITVNFNTRLGTNPGGIGFIGGLITQGANKTAAPGDPMPGVPIIAYSHTLGRPAGYAVSDANGYVGFYFLTPGTYSFIPDKPGVSVTNVPVVTLDAQNMVMDSLDLRLHSTYLELVTPTAIAPGGVKALKWNVHPNPISGNGTVSIDLPGDTQVRLSVHDVLGRECLLGLDANLTAGHHEWTLDPQRAGLKAGTYFLRLKAGESQRTLKVVIW